MKRIVDKVSRALICTSLGLVVTGSFCWVILLASNFKGF